MTTLTFPASLSQWQAQVTWHLEANTAAFVSPFTRAAQTVELAGARWVCDMTFPQMTEARWRPYHVWLAKMRGQAGRVYFGPPHYTGSTAPTWTPDPSATMCDSDVITCDSATVTCDECALSAWGSPVIAGSGQRGYSVRTSGWVNDITVLMAGDYFSYDTSVGRTLHMVVEDATSDGHGIARITVEPPIRTSPDDATEIETQTPTCIMALQASMTGAPSFSAPLRVAAALQLVEAF